MFQHSSGNGHQHLHSIHKQTITVLRAQNSPLNTNMPPATWSSIQEIIEDMEPSHPSETPSDNEEAPNLAEAINLMTEELKHHDNKNGKAKAKEPDTFDGSNPHKLTSFLLLCNLYFCNNLSYANDDAKITFALTYLHGMALDFFEPALSGLDDWSTFVCILHTQFGPIDPTVIYKFSPFLCSLIWFLVLLFWLALDFVMPWHFIMFSLFHYLQPLSLCLLSSVHHPPFCLLSLCHFITLISVLCPLSLSHPFFPYPSLPTPCLSILFYYYLPNIHSLLLASLFRLCLPYILSLVTLWVIFYILYTTLSLVVYKSFQLVVLFLSLWLSSLVVYSVSSILP